MGLATERLAAASVKSVVSWNRILLNAQLGDFCIQMSSEMKDGAAETYGQWVPRLLLTSNSGALIWGSYGSLPWWTQLTWIFLRPARHPGIVTTAMRTIRASLYFLGNNWSNSSPNLKKCSSPDFCKSKFPDDFPTLELRILPRISWPTWSLFPELMVGWV